MDTFARDVAGDADVFGFAADLVDFVDVDDADFGAGDIVVGGLEEAEDGAWSLLLDGLFQTLLLSH